MAPFSYIKFLTLILKFYNFNEMQFTDMVATLFFPSQETFFHKLLHFNFFLKWINKKL